MADRVKCPNCDVEVRWHQESMPLLRTHLLGLPATVLQNGFCEMRCVVYLHTRLREASQSATTPIMLPGGCCWWQRPEEA